MKPVTIAAASFFTWAALVMPHPLLAQANIIPPPPQLAPAPIAAPPPPLGYVFSRYLDCSQVRNEGGPAEDGTPLPGPPVCFVAVYADGLNVRAVPAGPPIMALVNGTPLVVLNQVGSWTLVAPACSLTSTFLWSWTANVPLNRCWVW
jgi:hypothetical protein